MCHHFIYLVEDLNVNNLELYLFQEALADEARMRAKFENDTEIEHLIQSMRRTIYDNEYDVFSSHCDAFMKK